MTDKPDIKLWTFEEYMYLASRTMNWDLDSTTQLAHLGLGLASEAGEVAGLVDKIIGQGHIIDKKHIIKELGDVLWDWAMLCRYFHLEPSEVAAANIEKLKARYPEGFSVSASVNRKEEDK